MNTTTKTLLFALMSLLLQCITERCCIIVVSAASVSVPDNKLEKLQIDGTIRNVDESKLNNNNHSEAVRQAAFDRYWSLLIGSNRSRRTHSPSLSSSSSSSVTTKPMESHESRLTALKRANNQMDNNNHDNDNNNIILDNNNKTNNKESYINEEEMPDSEVELIDPSKVSRQLANLKFMRLEKLPLVDYEKQQDV